MAAKDNSFGPKLVAIAPAVYGADIGPSIGYKWVLELAKKLKEVGIIKGFIFHQGETRATTVLNGPPT